MSWVIRHKEEGLYLGSGFPWWVREQRLARRFRSRAHALKWAAAQAHDMVSIVVRRIVPREQPVDRAKLQEEGASMERARLVQWLWDGRTPFGTRVAARQLAELVAKKEHHR